MKKIIFILTIMIPLASGWGKNVRVAQVGDTVKVLYTGWLFDKTAKENKGKKFDSATDRKKPFSFHLGAGEVIKGWDEGVAGMKVGDKKTLTIPPEKAYGADGAGQGLIQPNSTLIFEIELLEAN